VHPKCCDQATAVRIDDGVISAFPFFFSFNPTHVGENEYPPPKRAFPFSSSDLPALK